MTFVKYEYTAGLATIWCQDIWKGQDDLHLFVPNQSIWGLQHDHHTWWGHQMETFPHYWPFVREFTGPGEFPSQRPVTRSFEFSLICARINGWINNDEAGDFRCHRAHYDIIVMINSALDNSALDNWGLTHFLKGVMTSWAHNKHRLLYIYVEVISRKSLFESENITHYLWSTMIGNLVNAPMGKRASFTKYVSLRINGMPFCSHPNRSQAFVAIFCSWYATFVVITCAKNL